MAHLSFFEGWDSADAYALDVFDVCRNKAATARLIREARRRRLNPIVENPV
jgi:hypothetical protein